MKQIPSQFFDEEQYKKLNEVKARNNWTWKDLILSTLKENKKK